MLKNIKIIIDNKSINKNDIIQMKNRKIDNQNEKIENEEWGYTHDFNILIINFENNKNAQKKEFERLISNVLI